MKRDDYDDGTTNTKLLFVVTAGLVIMALLGCIGLILTISDMNVTDDGVVFIPIHVENQTVNTTQTVNSTVENQTVIQRSNLTMSVIDVGQADAILLEKDGIELLIDAGVSMKGSSASKKNLIDYLDDREIEHVLVTHQDYDHIGNAEYILANYNVSAFYDNGHVHTSQTYENLMDYVAENENKDCYQNIFIATLYLYCISVVVCCVTLAGVTTGDLSVGALRMLLLLNIGFFLTPIVPIMIYAVVALIFAIKNKIKHYMDIFHYYEELKSDEDKKHLLYNNKSKMKP